MRRAVAALVLATAAASIPGAAAGSGIGLSASPLRLTLRGASASAVTVRNPSHRTLRVEASRAGFTRSLRGKPLVRPARGAVTWLRLHPRPAAQRAGEAGPRGVDEQGAASGVTDNDRGGRRASQCQAQRAGTQRDAPTGRGTRDGCRGRSEDERYEGTPHLPITVNVSVAV